MINFKAIAVLSILATTALSTPAFSQEKSSSSQKTSAINTHKIAIMPWSKVSLPSPKRFESVQIEDKSGTQSVAAIDKTSKQQWGNVTDRGVISYWYSDKLRVYAYSIVKSETHVKSTSNITIQVDNKTYWLKGENNYYQVTPELANALKTDRSSAATIKIEFADDALPILAEIGTDTLTALKSLYQQAKAPSEIIDTQKAAEWLTIATRNTAALKPFPIVENR